jgi:6-phosphogluconate dehydrogenase (decarboxylating)
LARGRLKVESLGDFMAKLKPLRTVWLMEPAAAVEVNVQDLGTEMQQRDIVIDGGSRQLLLC